MKTSPRSKGSLVAAVTGARTVQSLLILWRWPRAIRSRDRAGVRPAIFETSSKIVVRRWEIADRYACVSFRHNALLERYTQLLAGRWHCATCLMKIALLNVFERHSDSLSTSIRTSATATGRCARARAGRTGIVTDPAGTATAHYRCLQKRHYQHNRR